MQKHIRNILKVKVFQTFINGENVDNLVALIENTELKTSNKKRRIPRYAWKFLKNVFDRKIRQAIRPVQVT